MKKRLQKELQKKLLRKLQKELKTSLIFQALLSLKFENQCKSCITVDLWLIDSYLLN